MLDKSATLEKPLPVNDLSLSSNFECVINRRKLFLFRYLPALIPSLCGRLLVAGLLRVPPAQAVNQLARSALGWQRQELVILVSAPAQSFLNFAFVAAASVWFFFCACRLLASP